MYKEMKGRTGKIAGVWISSSFVIHFLLCARTRILSNSRESWGGWVRDCTVLLSWIMNKKECLERNVINRGLVYIMCRLNEVNIVIRIITI